MLSIVKLFALLTVASVGAATAASAQSTTPKPDPIIGTWRLKPTEARVSAGAPLVAPTQQTEVYRLVDPDRIELTLTRTVGDAAASTIVVSWPAGGGVLQWVTAPTRENQVLIETLVAPGEWYVTYWSDGKQFMTMHKVISSDGKIMRQTVRGGFDQGKPFEVVLVFARED